MPAFCIDIHFVTLPKGFSQELRGSWDFLFLESSSSSPDLRIAKGEKPAPLGSASRLSFCLFFPAPILSFGVPRPRCTRWRLHRPDNSVKLANAYFPCTSLLLWHWGCVDAPNMPPFYRDCPHPNPRASPGGGPEPVFGPAAALRFSQCSTVTSSSLFRFLGSGAMGR